MRKIVTILVFLGGLREIVYGCVFITVSSLPERMLELNWNCHDSIDTVTLFSKNPAQTEGLKPLIEVSISNKSEKFHTTDIKFDPEPFPGGWSREDQESKETKSQCLYWITASYQGQTVHSNCLNIQPAWMTEHRYELQNLSLPMLFIPGTHNSGSDKIQTVSKRDIGSKLENLVLTQDESIWNQLVYGIRYFDLRIGYYSEENENENDIRFWINHDLLRMQLLIPILKDIASFLKYSPDEIIILDFHRFPVGFTSAAIHRQLLQVIQDELGNLIIDRPLIQGKLTLKEIWETNKRIVISYSDDNMVRETPWLWESVTQKWGNKQSSQDLDKFLEETFNEHGGIKTKLWAAMAELTPTSLDFFTNNTLRGMAQSVNHNLGIWFNDKKNWTRNANIVATDFFLGNNLIDIAIRENLLRSRESLWRLMISA